MKKQYTEMMTSLRRSHKRTGLSFEEIHADMVSYIRTHPSKSNVMRGAIGEIELRYETTQKAEFRHVFLPELPFCEWLAECAKVLEPELIDSVIEGLGSDFVCLHFPVDAKRASAMVWMQRHEKDKLREDQGNILINFSMDAPWGAGAVSTRFNGRIAAGDLKCGYMPDDADTAHLTEDPRAQMAEWYTKLIAGLGLYMSCFPEQVKDGIPTDAKRAEYARGNAKTIGVSETVVCRDGPTPHYRSGHFRLLSSDRYVNKKGQVVFIHGCFVKGQAKTVLSPEEKA